MKKFAWKKCRKMFFEALFFAFEKNFFQSFCTKFWSLPFTVHEIIGLQLSQCLSANHNPELRCVICTGVTLFAQVLHLNCTALSQSESSNFFMCIIKNKTHTAVTNITNKCIVTFQHIQCLVLFSSFSSDIQVTISQNLHYWRTDALMAILFTV